MVIFHCYVSSPEGNYSRGITASCCFPAERPYGPDLFDGCGVLQQWRNTLAHKYPLVTNGLNMILHDPIYSNLRWCTPVYIYIYIFFFVYYVIYKQQSTCATRFHCPRTSGASIGVLTQKSFFFSRVEVPNLVNQSKENHGQLILVLIWWRCKATLATCL